MQIKVLEVRDRRTFIPVICIKPIADNEGQRYLLRCDGYAADASETRVIVIKNQCYAVSYDPYKWSENPRTMRAAHMCIEANWERLRDGDVVDVEHYLGETKTKKVSERESVYGCDESKPSE